MRRGGPAVLVLALAVATAGCIPVRDNGRDPVNSPDIAVEVTLDGAPTLSGTRAQDLQIRVEASDPQEAGDIDVTVTIYDPHEGEALDCGSFSEESTGLVVGSSGVATVPFSFPADLCFSQTTSTEVPYQLIGVRAAARDRGGDRSETDLGDRFRLLDAIPVAEAGPDLWIDPTAGDTFVLSAYRSRDDDLAFGDQLTYEWSPFDYGVTPATAGTSRELTDTFDPGRQVQTYRLVVVDAAGARSAPDLVDVYRRRARWTLASDGLVLLDATFASARRVLDATTGTPTTLPIGCGSALPVFDGLQYFRNTDDVSTPVDDRLFAQRVGSDLRIRRIGLPAGYLFTRPLGTSAIGDISWVEGQNGATFGIIEVSGNAAILRAEADTLETGETQGVTQWDLASPLWRVQDDQVGGFAVVRVDPAGLEDRLDLNAAVDDMGGCFTSGPGSLRGAAAAPDGAVWAVFREAIVRVSEDLAQISCTPTGSAENPIAFTWVPSEAPAPVPDPGQVVLGYLNAGNALRFVGGGVSVEGPLVTVFRQGLQFDPIHRELSVAGPAGVFRWSDADYTTPSISAAPPPDVCSTNDANQNNGLVVDAQGASWSLARDNVTAIRLTRLPTALRLGRSQSSIGPTSPDRSSVDPRTGRVWVARRIPGSLSYEARAFDESGPVPDPDDPSADLVIPLDTQVDHLLYDPGTCPGASCRAAGFWIAYRDGITQTIALLAADGTPQFATALTGTLFSAVLDPADGALWTSEVLGTAVTTRLFLVDGSTQSLASGVNFDFSDPRTVPASSGFVDEQGRYVTARNIAGGAVPSSRKLLRVSRGTPLTEAFLPAGAIEICGNGGGAAPDEPGAIALDPVTDQIEVFCFDFPTPAAFDSQPTLVDIRRLSEGTGALQDTVLATAITSDPIRGAAYVDPVDGGTWVTSGATVFVLDRNLDLTVDRSAALETNLHTPVPH